ncbi:protein D7-like isoform X2 [Hyla sarda]|nr:protein D7-like isoform X2 [Hyla sarda]
MDSEGLLQCPYDKNHMIRPSRFPYHLVKCRENNKDVAKVLATCPFNARHRVPKKELDLHMQSCESKCPLEPLPDDAVMQKHEQLSSWQGPPCDENWEEEDSSTCTPFVLNEFGNYQPYSSHETVYEQSSTRATSGTNCGDGCPSYSYTNDAVGQKSEHSSSWQSRPIEKNWGNGSSTSAAFVLNKSGNHQPYNTHETVYKQAMPRAASGASHNNLKNPWKPAPNGRSYAYTS